MNYFTKTTIDFTDKPEGFREALEKVLAKRGVHGLMCELGTPNLSIYQDPKRKLWRMRQVNPALVCADLHNPVFEDNTVTFDVRAWGPCRDRYEFDTNRGVKFVLAARMIKDTKGKVIEICNFDMLPEHHHVDFAMEKVK